VVRPQGGVRQLPGRGPQGPPAHRRQAESPPPFAAVSDILIERTREEVTITLKTARPGLVIGPKGAEVDKLREELEDLIGRKVAPVKVIESRIRT
jgi:ribosomal protein S3